MTDSVTIGENSVRITRLLPYPRAVIFEAWVEPEQLAKWWGCKQTHRITAKSDARKGGEVEYIMHMDHGDVICTGRYEVFERPARLVTRCTMGKGTDYEFESVTTVELTEQNGGTQICIEQIGLPPVPNCGDIVKGGLSDSFDKLAVHLSPEASS